MKRAGSPHSEAPQAKHAENEIPDENTETVDIRQLRNHESMQKFTKMSMSNGKEYDVKKVLGEGVFGIVFEVSDQDNQKFAAKVMKQSNEPPNVWMIELHILEEIANDPHPALLELHDVGTMLKPPICCTENVIFTRLLGPSLLDIISEAEEISPKNYDSNCTFPLKAIQNVGLQVLQAMIHLEKLGIYHLDLKPENIYFWNGEFRLQTFCSQHQSIVMTDLRIQIGDFGCSKYHVADGETVRPTTVQTQNYRAPEIFMGLPHSEKSDVWSFGAVLCEMYTGELLFYGTDDDDSEYTQFEMMQKVVMQYPTRNMWKRAVAIGSTKVMETAPRGFSLVKRAPRMDETTTLFEKIRDNDIMAVGFFIMLQEMLIWEPEQRPSFKDLENHQFFKSL